MKTIKTIIGFILFVGLFIGLICFSYWVWHLQHPDAPPWTFLFSS